MPHAFSQSEHLVGQCGHVSQIELFEKPRFIVMNVLGLTININNLNMPKNCVTSFLSLV